ncbi:MAG TPA: hypothetical protein PK250_15120 [Syntrophobacter fumaroxidans]|nr:hypothetical protein [Syntrophobacter fumaroxidans]
MSVLRGIHQRLGSGRAAGLLVFSIVFGLAMIFGCVPYSDHPLSAPGQESLDNRLFGTWYSKDEKESVFIHFGFNAKSGLLNVVMVDMRSDGELEYSELNGHNTGIDGASYLSLKWAKPEEEDADGYLFVKYVVDEKGLGICIVELDVVEKGIVSGEIKGEITKRRLSSSVRIKDTSENLRAFVKKHDRELFPEMQYLSKLQAQRTR